MIEALLRDVGLLGVVALGLASFAPLLGVWRARDALSRAGLIIRLSALALGLVVVGGAVVASGLIAAGPVESILPSWAQALAMIALAALILNWCARRFVDIGASRWWAATPIVLGLVIGAARLAFVDWFFDLYIALFRAGIPPALVSMWGAAPFAVWLVAVAIWPAGRRFEDA